MRVTAVMEYHTSLRGLTGKNGMEAVKLRVLVKVNVA